MLSNVYLIVFKARLQEVFISTKKYHIGVFLLCYVLDTRLLFLVYILPYEHLLEII